MVCIEHRTAWPQNHGYHTLVWDKNLTLKPYEKLHLGCQYGHRESTIDHIMADKFALRSVGIEIVTFRFRLCIKQKCGHFDEIFGTGCTGSGQNYSSAINQGRKFSTFPISFIEFTYVCEFAIYFFQYEKYSPYSYRDKQDLVYVKDLSLGYNYLANGTEWYHTLRIKDWSNATVTVNMIEYRSVKRVCFMIGSSGSKVVVVVVFVVVGSNNISSTWWRLRMETFPRYWPFVQGIHRSPVNSLHKGQWRGALMFSLICAWINGWANNGEAGDLRRHRAHYDVIVIYSNNSSSSNSSSGSSSFDSGAISINCGANFIYKSYHR